MTNLEQQSTGDLMREAGNEFLAWSICTDAQDMLYIVRDMTPAQRANIKDDLVLAADFISKAIKECAS